MMSVRELERNTYFLRAMYVRVDGSNAIVLAPMTANRLEEPVARRLPRYSPQQIATTVGISSHCKCVALGTMDLTTKPMSFRGPALGVSPVPRAVRLGLRTYPLTKFYPIVLLSTELHASIKCRTFLPDRTWRPQRLRHKSYPNVLTHLACSTG